MTSSDQRQPLSRREREFIRSLVSERVRKLVPYRREEPFRSRCRYCGQWTKRKSGVCSTHADLPELEQREGGNQ